MGQVTDAYQREFKCLIADDSAFARKNIANIVSTMGGTVVGEAVNGLEAVDQYFELSPDVVLLDITMPELDGVETLRRIMAKDDTAKVIIVSSIGHKEMVWKAITIGAKHFISKPFEANYAISIIRSVLKNGKEGGSCATNT
jgi:two-component system chemotaxis response regulator CheY